MTDEEESKLASKLDRVIKELTIIRRVLVVGLFAVVLYLLAAVLIGFLVQITNSQVVKVGSEIHSSH
jgi:hypothetical protein